MTAAIAGQASLLPPPARPVLRTYQAADVAKILACLQRGRSPLYELPTGGGKSVCLAAVCHAVVEHGWTVWLFAHRRELIKQMSGHLLAAGLDHGIVSPEHATTSDPVQICSIDTIRARFGSLRDRMAGVNLMIIDEAHHASSDSYSLAIQGATNARLLGVTATPFRYDGRPLGGMFNEAVRGPSAARLEADGYLAPVKIFAPSTKLDLRKVKKRMGDFIASQIEGVVNTDEITQAAIYAYALHAGGLPTIAYCVTVRHAEDCAAAFRKVGWSVELIEGKMRKHDRDRAITGLANGRHQILFSIDCISEGVDVPVVSAGLMLRPTASTGLYLQQIGRLRRIYRGKDHAVLIDMVANWSRHGMPNAERQWSLTESVKGLERAVAAVRRCGSCHYVCERGPERCANCNRKYPVPIGARGFAMPARATVMPGFASLSPQQIKLAQLKSLLPLARTRDDLEQIGAIKGYGRGWVAHVMRERGMVERPRPAAVVPLRRFGRNF